ncbi:hypothetical protein M5689_001161 [Euphorbia peplus]|nr:hypothetical protein M5689_001161 [Euphorbia peplus]
MASLSCFCLLISIAFTLNVGIAARNLGALPQFQDLPQLPNLPSRGFGDIKLPPMFANLPKPAKRRPTTRIRRPALSNPRPMSLRSTAVMPQKADGGIKTGPAIGQSQGSTMISRNLGALPFAQGLPPLPNLPFPQLPKPDLSKFGLPPLPDLPEFLNPLDLPNPFEQFTAKPGAASSQKPTTSQITTPGLASTANARNLGALPFAQGLPPLPNLPFPQLPKPDLSKFGLPPLPDLPEFLNPLDLPNPFEQFTSKAASTQKLATTQMASQGAGSTANARNLGALPFAQGLPPLPDLPTPFSFLDGELPQLPKPDFLKFGLPPLPDFLNPLDLPNPFEQLSKSSSKPKPLVAASTSSTPGRTLSELQMKMSSKLSSTGEPQARNLLNFPEFHFPNIFHFGKSSPSPKSSPSSKSSPSTPQKASPSMKQPTQVPSNKPSNGMPTTNPSTLPAQQIPNQQPNGVGNQGMSNRNPSSNQQQPLLGNQVSSNGAGNTGMPNQNQPMKQQQSQPQQQLPQPQPMNQNQPMQQQQSLPQQQQQPQPQPMNQNQHMQQQQSQPQPQPQPMPMRLSANPSQQQLMPMGDYPMPMRLSANPSQQQPMSMGNYPMPMKLSTNPSQQQAMDHAMPLRPINRGSYRVANNGREGLMMN